MDCLWNESYGKCWRRRHRVSISDTYKYCFSHLLPFLHLRVKSCWCWHLLCIGDTFHLMYSHFDWHHNRQLCSWLLRYIGRLSRRRWNSANLVLLSQCYSNKFIVCSQYLQNCWRQCRDRPLIKLFLSPNSVGRRSYWHRFRHGLLLLHGVDCWRRIPENFEWAEALRWVHLHYDNNRRPCFHSHFGDWNRSLRSNCIQYRTTNKWQELLCNHLTCHYRHQGTWDCGSWFSLQKQHVFIANLYNCRHCFDKFNC